ncbi:long-chain fatty acid--CoA ligase [Actinomadura nitritigenes]|uniref:AMP-binding protein n=1 Tax=Actinomadura nitritigenes TaxID=134602 RepID=A0ABS3RI96_9ACTN|nr:AMP-binding protein [Actinomadura nitritigenes]MBO2445343.1 AMP-binding protein [Actinomadura nitritigenes]
MNAEPTTDPTPIPSLDNLGQLLPSAARRWPRRTALVTDERSLTFEELDRLASRVAHALSARGVGFGDRVSLVSQNRWEWVVAYHGALRCGAVVNPLNVMLTGEELAYILSDSGAKVLLASGERLEAVGGVLEGVQSLERVVAFDGATRQVESFESLLASAEATPFEPVSVDPRSLACIAYTSGTTGHPKGAMQSHLSLVLNCAYTATMHVRTIDDIVVTALPSAHVYGNVVINSTWMAGGCVVLMTRFDPEGAIRRIEQHGATMFEGVPAMYATMLATPALAEADLSTLIRSTVGGQTIAESVIDAWETRTSAPLIELWGMTELSGLGSTHALYAPNVHGSIGVVLPGNELRVISTEDGVTECRPGEPGELMARGPLVTMGYYNNDAATAEAITPDGWLHTGDIATHDGTGRFFVVDRLKDMILTAGYNVYPAEIERVLIGHASVALVAVGREPDPVKGEVAHAYVVPAHGSTPDAEELSGYCRQHLAPYKVPRAIHFVDQLPTTSSGKLMRRMLRQSAATLS